MERARARAGRKPIRISLGLHYGPVVIGNIGTDRRLEFGVLGDTVNVASRLEALTRELDCRAVISDAIAEAVSTRRRARRSSVFAASPSAGRRRCGPRGEGAGPDLRLRGIGAEALQILNLSPAPELRRSLRNDRDARFPRRTCDAESAASGASPAETAGSSGLEARIPGRRAPAGREAYQEACRIWNAMIERRPALVVRPAGAEDVAETIRFAKEHGLPLSVRGGGHNVAGAALADGGITIDMSQRRAVAVDAARQTVTRRAGRDVEGRGRGDAAARPRRAERHHLGNRRRRLHARRRLRLDIAKARLRRRQSVSRPRSSPPTARSAAQAQTRTRTCSGRCAAAAAISAL